MKQTFKVGGSLERVFKQWKLAEVTEQLKKKWKAQEEKMQSE